MCVYGKARKTLCLCEFVRFCLCIRFPSWIFMLLLRGCVQGDVSFHRFEYHRGKCACVFLYLVDEIGMLCRKESVRNISA